MYKLGDTVIHRTHGISIIVSIMDIEGRSYYKVQPRKDQRLAIYVPTSNDKGILRDVLSVEEADELLVYMKGISEEVIPETKAKRDEFRHMFSNGDIKDLAFLSKKLYLSKQNKISKNLKVGAVDSYILEQSTAILLDELSLTYGVAPEKIIDYIANKIEKM